MHLNHQSHLARNYKRLDSSDQKMFYELKKVKYPVLAIEPAQSLQKKLLQFSKNQKLYTHMKQKLIKQHGLNSYRKIRGDGNCFFRALAYSILSSVKDLSNVQETFYYLKEISLTSCHQKSIPKEFCPFYRDDLLKLILQQNWGLNVRHFKSLYKMNNKRILSRMFRKYPYLDFIVILYFRALCLKGLQKHKSEVKQFMKGTEEDQVRTYGQESEGVILDICSRFLKISIDVYEVRSQQIKHYSYKKVNFLSFGGSTNQVSLLYYENHYDIVEELSQKQLMQEQDDSKIQQEEYYSKINDKMVEGFCIQCERSGFIYEDNSLCEDCFNMSRNELINTVKSGKLVRGICRQCGRKDVKVQQMIEICQQCIQRQQSAQQQSIKQTYLKKQLPKKHTSPTEQSYFPPQQQEIDYCLQCDKRSVIDPETKLCYNCKSIQQLVLKRQEQRRTKCPNCRQHLNSQFHEFKCVKKLTQGKISIKNQHYDQNKCKDCRELILNDELIDGTCLKCMRKARQLREKIRAQNQARVQNQLRQENQQKQGQTIKSIGSKIYGQNQRCIQCNRSSYVTALKNGRCSTCLRNLSSNIRF